MQVEVSEFASECYKYTEPNGAVVLQPNPGPRSCDNALLFTATFLCLLKVRGEAKIENWEWFLDLVRTYEMEPGAYARFPQSQESTHWDDHCALACASGFYQDPNLARDIFSYGVRHDWVWGTGFLGRIIDFPPVVKAAAGVKLNLLSQVLVAAGFIANLWEPRSETSGKCLLYLKSLSLSVTTESFIVRLSILLWKWRMRRLYGDLRGIYEIYFGTHHPFTRYAPKL